MMVSDLIEGNIIQVKDSKQFIGRYGIFYHLLVHLHHTELWSLLRQLAEDSPETARPIVSLVISRILDLVDQCSQPGEVFLAHFDEMIRALYQQLGREKSLPDNTFLLDLLSQVERLPGMLSRFSAELSRHSFD